MKNSSNVLGKDQQKMIMIQDNAEGIMGNKEEEETTIETTIMKGTTDTMRPPRKEELGPMQLLARYIMDNTYGGSADSIRMVTIETTMEEIKATREITKETKAIPMETTAIKGSRRGLIPVMWMNTAI